MSRSPVAAPLAVAVLMALSVWSCGSKARVGSPTAERANSVTTDQEFELGPGQSVLVGSEPLKITFEAVTADSRCPPEVQCVWAGDAVAKILAATGSQAPATYELHTNSGFATQVTHGPYRIRLSAVAPGPHNGVTIDPSSYVVTLVVTKP